MAIVAVLLAITPAPASISGQTKPRAQPDTKAGSVDQSPSQSTTPIAASPNTDVQDYQPSRITVANLPAPPMAEPAPWSLRERITWGANLVLVLLAYVGIMLALSALRKIERQTHYAESAAEAANAAAQAALLHAQSIIRAERPWILITVEPSPSIKNSFTVMATNRGRSAARIVASIQGLAIVAEETHLPARPEYKREQIDAPFFPIILLPGESTAIKPFSRDEAVGICDSEEQFRRVENWEEKVYLYGNILYKDLIAPEDQQTHETAWCCWYIHGRQKSGLVQAGPPSYNTHT